MAHEYTMRHRVEFADTDMAGIIHFSAYFRYMEVTEHAFFRSLGLSIVGTPDIGWPRVHVSCDYRSPLKFEDEIDVTLRVAEKRSKSLSYSFVFTSSSIRSRTVSGPPAITYPPSTRSFHVSSLNCLMPERWYWEIAPCLIVLMVL